MKKYIIVLFAIVIVGKVNAQDIDDLLDSQFADEINYVSATFKATRVINGHSVEQLKKRHLDFRITHRFGAVNTGIKELYGLDKATIQFNFEYGISDWLMVGLGRTSFNKTYTGFIKAKLLRQSSGKREMPFSVNYFTSTEINTIDFPNQDRENLTSSRYTYVHQLLIARKFNKNLSLQITPSLVHRNLVATTADKNDLYAIGFGGRYKVSKRIALMAEYYYTNHSSNTSTVYNNPIAFGVDIETGGHVFQLMLTNTSVMYDGGFIAGANNDDFFDGGVHFGFNISRIFSFKKE